MKSIDEGKLTDWQPSCSLAHLRKRADILSLIRAFFSKKNILEVETPLLSHASATNPYVLSIPALFKRHGESTVKEVYLQTSPEHAMKRLLSAGSGPIYQLCKAFRQGDLGQFHNPEFTLLEWYRPGFNHFDLMDEVDEFLQLVLKTKSAERFSYESLFQSFVGINPHNTSLKELQNCVSQHINLSSIDADKNTYLELLLSHCIEPHIGQNQPVFIYDFPIYNAALAKIRYEDNPPVASRFEVYFKGLELANGFHELQDSTEQRNRFDADIEYRKKNKLDLVPIDELFLQSLKVGLPDCAGVALGIDRLIMLALNAKSIHEVLSFHFENA